MSKNYDNDDSFVSHTFDHWLRDLEDFKDFDLTREARKAADKVFPINLEKSEDELGQITYTNKNCTLRLGYRLGYKQGFEAAIEKAVEWMKKYGDSYMWYNEMDGECGITDDFEDAFRKAVQYENI